MQVGEETLSKNSACVGIVMLDFMLKITFLVSELGFHICTCGHNTVFMYELQSWLLAKTVQGLRL